MRKLLISAVTMTVAALLLAPAASAAPDDVNTQRLRNGVTNSGILNHMRALQRAANANDGNRAANTTGYDASAGLRRATHESRRLETERVPFEYRDWAQNGSSMLQRWVALPTSRARTRPPTTITSRSSRAPGMSTAPVVTDRHTPSSRPQRVLAPPRAAARQPTGGPGPDRQGGARSARRLRLRGQDRARQEAGAAAVLIFNDGGPEDRDRAVPVRAEPFTTIPVAMRARRRRGALTAAQAGPTASRSRSTTTTTESVSRRT